VDLTSGIPAEKELMLTERPEDDLLREAVNMWIWDDAAQFGLPRVAVEAIGSRWEDRAVQVNIAFPDGRVLLGTCVGSAHPTKGPEGEATVFGAGPLAFTCVEPFLRWRVAFAGTARETTVAEQVTGAGVERPRVDVAFDVEATMAVPPWYPGQFSTSAKSAFDQGVEGSFISARYEQLFRAEGTFRVGDHQTRFSGGGLRIRRQGRRNSTELWGHCWQAALFPSGRGFAYNAFPPRPDGTPSYNEGYVFDAGEMVAATALTAPWMHVFEPSGGDVSLSLATASGTVSIEGETVHSTYVRRVSELNDMFGMPFLGGGDRLAFHQGIARYRWDGEETYGMIERSFPLAEMGPPRIGT
jgi:hypothetical protein